MYETDVVVTAKSNFEVPPQGLNNAVCNGVWNCGHHKNTFKDDGTLIQKVVLGFEVEEKYTMGDMAGTQICIFKIYTMSIGSKSTLGKHLVSWRGKKFTDEEKEGFKLNVLVGIPCTLNINDEGYIDTVLPHQPGRQILKQEWSKKEIPKYVQKIREGAVDQLITTDIAPPPAQESTLETKEEKDVSFDFKNPEGKKAEDTPPEETVPF